MASLDRSKCPAVESIPGKVSGAWVFKDTRMPHDQPIATREISCSRKQKRGRFAGDLGGDRGGSDKGR